MEIVMIKYTLSLLVLISASAFAQEIAHDKGHPLKHDVRELEQKVKEKEQAYHKSVQDTEDAKKNNLSKDEIAHREQAQEKAKQEWQNAKQK